MQLNRFRHAAKPAMQHVMRPTIATIIHVHVQTHQCGAAGGPTEAAQKQNGRTGRILELSADVKEAWDPLVKNHRVHGAGLGSLW